MPLWIDPKAVITADSSGAAFDGGAGLAGSGRLCRFRPESRCAGGQPRRRGGAQRPDRRGAGRLADRADDPGRKARPVEPDGRRAPDRAQFPHHRGLVSSRPRWRSRAASWRRSAASRSTPGSPIPPASTPMKSCSFTSATRSPRSPGWSGRCAALHASPSRRARRGALPLPCGRNSLPFSPPGRFEADAGWIDFHIGPASDDIRLTGSIQLRRRLSPMRRVPHG